MLFLIFFNLCCICSYLCLFLFFCLTLKGPDYALPGGGVGWCSEWRTSGWATIVHVVLPPQPCPTTCSIPAPFPWVWLFLRSCILSFIFINYGIWGQKNREKSKEISEGNAKDGVPPACTCGFSLLSQLSSCAFLLLFSSSLLVLGCSASLWQRWVMAFQGNVMERNGPH